MEKLYTTRVTSQGGRNGRVTSSDGVLNLEVRMPKEMGGSGGNATNPEQLFAAGYAACFNSALQMVAKKKKVDAENAEVTADVSIGKGADGGFQLGVQLHVNIPGVDANTAKTLAEEAHTVCPYSKATRGNIDVQLTAGE